MKKEVISLANKQKTTETTEKRISRTGFAWCLYLVGTNLMKMVWLSVIVFLCSCTVVLAPAAITGANRSLLILLRGKGGLFWDDFREDFLDRFGKKLGYFLLMLLIPVAIGLWLYILGAGAKTARIVILVGLLVSAVVQSYFFPMLAAMKLSLGDCLKNAVLLMVLEWKTTLCFLVLYGAAGMGAFFLFPYSIPVLCFLLIGCMMLVVCQQVRRIILRRGLYLAEQEQTENCKDAVEGE